MSSLDDSSALHQALINQCRNSGMDSCPWKSLAKCPPRSDSNATSIEFLSRAELSRKFDQLGLVRMALEQQYTCCLKDATRRSFGRNLRITWLPLSSWGFWMSRDGFDSWFMRSSDLTAPWLRLACATRSSSMTSTGVASKLGDHTLQPPLHVAFLRQACRLWPNALACSAISWSLVAPLYGRMPLTRAMPSWEKTERAAYHLRRQRVASSISLCLRGRIHLYSTHYSFNASP